MIHWDKSNLFGCHPDMVSNGDGYEAGVYHLQDDAAFIRAPMDTDGGSKGQYHGPATVKAIVHDDGRIEYSVHELEVA